MDIAATVNPATVHFRSLTEPRRPRRRTELRIRPARARKAAAQVRRPGGHARAQGAGRRTTRKRRDRDLVSYNNAPVWRIGNGIVTGLQADHIRFPELPGNLYSRPTLIWTIANEGGAKHRVEASYLAGNLAWNADYVLTVARDESRPISTAGSR